jgi:hypothetical protein
VSAGGRVQARPVDVAFEQGERLSDRDRPLPDRGVEQPQTLVVCFDVGRQVAHPAEKALRVGQDRIANRAAPARTGLERPRRPFQRRETIEERLTMVRRGVIRVHRFTWW